MNLLFPFTFPPFLNFSITISKCHLICGVCPPFPHCLQMSFYILFKLGPSNAHILNLVDMSLVSFYVNSALHFHATHLKKAGCLFCKILHLLDLLGCFPVVPFTFVHLFPQFLVSKNLT